MKEDLTNDYSQEAIRASYAYGHIEAWLEVFTRSHGLSYPTIAGRVGELLQAQASREVLGANGNVSRMQSHTPRKYRTKRIKALEMVNGASHSEPPNKEVVNRRQRSKSYYHDPNKGQYSRAVLAIVGKKDGLLTPEALMKTVQLKNPDWKPQQIWGAINVAVKWEKLHKQLHKDGQWYLHLGKA